MQSTNDRRKNMYARAVLPSAGVELKVYDEIYQVYCQSGYSKEVAELFSETFVDNMKKPEIQDIIQAACLYDKICRSRNAEIYLDMLSDKKLSGSEKFDYCVLMLRTLGKLRRRREAEAFRTENINFLQNYAEKTTSQKKAELYIALALVDCAANKFEPAFRLIKSSGYKPKGRNDHTLMEILITGLYIYACEENEIIAEAVSASVKKTENESFDYDKEYYDKRIDDLENEIEAAAANARNGIRIIGEFEFEWYSKYYQKRIAQAIEMII